MNQLLKYGVIGLAAGMLLVGCAKGADTAGSDPSGAGSSDSGSAASSEASGNTDTFSNDLGSVTLGAYKGLELAAAKLPTVAAGGAEVSEEELEAEIDQVIQGNAEYVEVTDRPAQDGDRVNIDYVGMKDGVAFEGGTAAGYDLVLGSGSFIGGFEEGLIGVNKGDERSLDLVFPEQYHRAELAGQAVVFDVTVNRIDEVVVPELNDEFVQQISESTTVQEFRDHLKAEMAVAKEEYLAVQESDMKKSLALQAVVDGAAFELKPEAVQAEYDRNYEYIQNIAGMYGVSPEEFMSVQGLDEAKLREQCELANKQQLAAEAICQKEAIEITDEIRQVVADGAQVTVDELVANYGQELVDRMAKVHAAADFLVENSVFK